MTHLGTRVLTTARLTLRPLTAADADAMYANWASDPAVTRWLRWDPHKDSLETLELLAGWECLYQNPDYYQWGVAETATGVLFGSISVFPGEGGGWEAGYCYGRAFWGRGYATEALQAVCAYWFGPVGGGELFSCHALGNPASGRVMEHCGFVYQGEAVYHRFSGEEVLCRAYRCTAPGSER